MTELEKLAVAQALYKAIAAAVSTKDPDSLRGRMDAAAIKGYEATGAKGFDLRLNGRKVGTYTVRVSRPVRRTDLAVTDREAFEAWCVANGIADATVEWRVSVPEVLMGNQGEAIDLLMRTGVLSAREVARVGDIEIMDAKRRMEETGEVPDGCVPITVDEPSRPLGTTLKVDAELVAEALGDCLPAALAGLLAEGGDAA